MADNHSADDAYESFVDFEAEEIIRHLRADAAFDFGSSVEWGRSGYDILDGALMHLLGITREDLAESAQAIRENEYYK